MEAMVTEVDAGVTVAVVVAVAVALHVVCSRDRARTVHFSLVSDSPATWPGLNANQQGTLVVTFRWTRTDPVSGSASWACTKHRLKLLVGATGGQKMASNLLCRVTPLMLQ